MIVFIFSFMFTKLDNCKSGLCKIDTGQRNTAIHETQRTAALLWGLTVVLLACHTTNKTTYKTNPDNSSYIHFVWSTMAEFAWNKKHLTKSHSFNGKNRNFPAQSASYVSIALADLLLRFACFVHYRCNWWSLVIPQLFKTQDHIQINL